MGRQDIAGSLKEAAALANAELEPIRNAPSVTVSELVDALRRYIKRKLQLEDEEVSDNIIRMVRISVARTMHVTEDALKSMDRPGQCGSAPAVLSMRVLLFLSVQKQLDVKLQPAQAADVETVQDLAALLLPLLGAA